MLFHLGSSPHRGMINIDRPLWPLRDRVFRGVDMHAGNLPGREGRGERESGVSLGSKFQSRMQTFSTHRLPSSALASDPFAVSFAFSPGARSLRQLRQRLVIGLQQLVT